MNTTSPPPPPPPSLAGDIDPPPQASSGGDYGTMDTAPPPPPPPPSSLAGDFEGPPHLPVPCTLRPPSYFEASASGAQGSRPHNNRHAKPEDETQTPEVETQTPEVFIDMKKLVFATMCMPVPSQTSTQCERNCSKYFFYLILPVFEVTFSPLSFCILSDLFFALCCRCFHCSANW